VFPFRGASCVVLRAVAIGCEFLWGLVEKVVYFVADLAGEVEKGEGFAAEPHVDPGEESLQNQRNLKNVLSFSRSWQKCGEIFFSVIGSAMSPMSESGSGSGGEDATNETVADRDQKSKWKEIPFWPIGMERRCDNMAAYWKQKH